MGVFCLRICGSFSFLLDAPQLVRELLSHFLVGGEHQEPQYRPYHPAYLEHHELVQAGEEQTEEPGRAHQQVQLQEEEVLFPEGVGVVPRRYLRASLYPYDFVRGEHEQYVIPEERQQRYAEEVDVYHEVWPAAVPTIIRFQRKIVRDSGAKFQDEGNDGRDESAAPGEDAVQKQSVVLLLIGLLTGSYHPAEPRDRQSHVEADYVEPEHSGVREVLQHDP